MPASLRLLERELGEPRSPMHWSLGGKPDDFAVSGSGVCNWAGFNEARELSGGLMEASARGLEERRVILRVLYRDALKPVPDFAADEGSKRILNGDD